MQRVYPLNIIRNISKTLQKVIDIEYRLEYTNLTNVNENHYQNPMLINLKKEDECMPLTMIEPGEEKVIKKVGGKEETKRFLESLGFVMGGMVTIISKIQGNVIVNVKDSRVAIGEDMARKILV